MEFSVSGLYVPASQSSSACRVVAAVVVVVVAVVVVVVVAVVVISYTGFWVFYRQPQSRQ